MLAWAALRTVLVRSALCTVTVPSALLYVNSVCTVSVKYRDSTVKILSILSVALLSVQQNRHPPLTQAQHPIVFREARRGIEGLCIVLRVFVTGGADIHQK